MSILIQGMEMPKPFDHLFVGENLAGDLFVRNDTQEGDDVVWYPLIEIPTHGRLIDADALDDAFTDLRWENGDYKSGALRHWGDRPHWWLTGSEVENLINAAPTIIPADREKPDEET